MDKNSCEKGNVLKLCGCGNMLLGLCQEQFLKIWRAVNP